MNDGFSYLEHDAKRALGSSNLTVSIYRAVADAGRPLTSDEIYAAVKDWINYTDTAIWWKKRTSSKSLGTTETYEHQVAARQRVQVRVHQLAATGVLVSDGQPGNRHGAGAHYKPGRPPKAFRKLERPGGWYDIDVRAVDDDRDRHIATISFLHAARGELAKERPQAKTLKPLLEEAVRLLTDRTSA